MTGLFIIFAFIEALLWGFKENRPAAIAVHVFFGLPIVVAALMCSLTYTPEAPATAIVDTKPTMVKVEAHAWFDKDTQTLYVDSQWDRTPLDLADDMDSLYDAANFKDKYEAAAREILSDEEFAAWQASQEAQRDVIFTLTNGNGRIRYDVRHVVDINTGDVIR